MKELIGQLHTKIQLLILEEQEIDMLKLRETNRFAWMKKTP